MTSILIHFYSSYKKYILYLIFGMLTTAVNFVIYFFLTEGLSINYLASNTVAWIGAVLFAFVTNKIYVFEAHDLTKRNVFTELVLFSSSRFFSFLVETAFLFLSIDVAHMDSRIAKVLIAVVVVILNFFLTKSVFSRKHHAEE